MLLVSFLTWVSRDRYGQRRRKRKMMEVGGIFSRNSLPFSTYQSSRSTAKPYEIPPFRLQKKKQTTEVFLGNSLNSKQIIISTPFFPVSPYAARYRISPLCYTPRVISFNRLVSWEYAYLVERQIIILLLFLFFFLFVIRCSILRRRNIFSIW